MILAIIYVILLIISTAWFTYSVTRLVIDNFMSFLEAKILPAILPISFSLMVFTGASLVLLVMR